MFIYEKIYARLEELNMSQSELSRKMGIATSTISDWKKKKINPQSDKIIDICKALDMSLVELLCDDSDVGYGLLSTDYTISDKKIIERIIYSSETDKRRIINYINLLYKESKKDRKNNRNVSFIQDIDGNKIVLINDIIFKGKRSIEWRDVEKYLRQFVGDYFQITETEDIVYIGSDLPDEYTGSNYTKHLKGTVAKAKANAAQAIPDIIEIANSKVFEENKKAKHSRHAKNGWYRYDTRFALPVYNEFDEVERYNIFSARLLIRHSADGKMYLYDLIEIKKETSKSCQA